MLRTRSPSASPPLSNRSSAYLPLSLKSSTEQIRLPFDTLRRPPRYGHAEAQADRRYYCFNFLDIPYPQSWYPAQVGLRQEHQIANINNAIIIETVFRQ